MNDADFEIRSFDPRRQVDFVRQSFPALVARLPKEAVPFGWESRAGTFAGLSTHPDDVCLFWGVFRMLPHLPDGYAAVVIAPKSAGEELIALWKRDGRCFAFQGRYMGMFDPQAMERTQAELALALERWDLGEDWGPSIS